MCFLLSNSFSSLANGKPENSLMFFLLSWAVPGLLNRSRCSSVMSECLIDYRKTRALLAKVVKTL